MIGFIEIIDRNIYTKTNDLTTVNLQKTWQKNSLMTCCSPVVQALVCNRSGYLISTEKKVTTHFESLPQTTDDENFAKTANASRGESRTESQMDRERGSGKAETLVGLPSPDTRTSDLGSSLVQQLWTRTTLSLSLGACLQRHQAVNNPWTITGLSRGQLSASPVVALPSPLPPVLLSGPQEPC